jgi:four helix bundle protein
MNQRLRCYNLLVDVAKAMPGLIKCIPSGKYYLTDQIERAMASSIANLAEGNGRFSIKERNRFFNYSLGSISELIGWLDIACSYRYLDNSISQKLKDNLWFAYNMIKKLKK